MKYKLVLIVIFFSINSAAELSGSVEYYDDDIVNKIECDLSDGRSSEYEKVTLKVFERSGQVEPQEIDPLVEIYRNDEEAPFYRLGRGWFVDKNVIERSEFEREALGRGTSAECKIYGYEEAKDLKLWFQYSCSYRAPFQGMAQLSLTDIFIYDIPYRANYKLKNCSNRGNE